MTSLFHVVNLIGSFIIGVSAAYFLIMVVGGVRALHRSDATLSSQAGIEFGHPFVGLASLDYNLYFVIPCLNEATVIAQTVTALRGGGTRARIIVVDDGSDDSTGAVAARAGGSDVLVVRRELPNARLGKGEGLNHAFAILVEDVVARGVDPASVLVCVMDADGRLTDGALSHVLPLFDDRDVGGVQLAVRIRNRATNFWLRFQNHQFWTLSALSQMGRVGVGTVSLGGNGQFTRLSALQQLGPAPWSASLTEDLDLAVSLAVRGWRLTSTPHAAVDQQGVESFSRLLTQRTRWYQGHMMTARRVPEIWRARRLSHAGALEMTLYILVPWLFDLPWSIVYHLILIELIWYLHGSGLISGSAGSWVAGAAVWYLLAFWPSFVTAILARRRDPTLPWPTAIVLAHGFIITNYVSYLCAWRALARIVTGRRSWVKTDRIAEPTTTASDVPVA
jgi:1,2-diacylglycerol 3-beta-glucosyltransferase